MKKLHLLSLSIFLSLISYGQNDYIYKIIDSTIIQDSSLFGAQIEIDIDNDDIIDMTIDYVYTDESDSVSFEDTTFYVVSKLDISSIMFDDYQLAFIIHDMNEEPTDSTFDALPKEPYEYIDHTANWSTDFAGAYQLYFGRSVNTSSGIANEGANYNKDIKYYPFRINMPQNNTDNWYYGWIQLEHKDGYIHIEDLFLNLVPDEGIHVGQTSK
jgi:hypothetical protein